MGSGSSSITGYVAGFSTVTYKLYKVPLAATLADGEGVPHLTQTAVPGVVKDEVNVGGPDGDGVSPANQPKCPGESIVKVPERSDRSESPEG